MLKEGTLGVHVSFQVQLAVNREAPASAVWIVDVLNCWSLRESLWLSEKPAPYTSLCFCARRMGQGAKKLAFLIETLCFDVTNAAHPPCATPEGFLIFKDERNTPLPDKKQHHNPARVKNPLCLYCSPPSAFPKGLCHSREDAPTRPPWMPAGEARPVCSPETHPCPTGSKRLP